MKAQLSWSVTVCALLLFACNSLVSFAENAPTEKNYQEYCASCHGQKVEAFVDRPNWKNGASKEDISRVIKDGLTDDGMPAFGGVLSDAEISSLTDYILTASSRIQSYDFGKIEEPFSATSEGKKFALELMTSAVDEPWGIVQLPDESLLITEKAGKLYKIEKDGSVNEIGGVPKVRYRSQGGLMDVILHPDYSANQIVYLSYSKPHPQDDNKSTTAIYMATMFQNQLIDGKDIFIAEPYFSTAHHYGSRMTFDNQGKLFVSVGDRGLENENPQSLQRDGGKIHRLNWDGTIPEDNPFFNASDIRKSIYSFGHRNPQGLIYDRTNDRLYDNEHGPRGGDEINLIKPGANYGWPIITYGINYNGTKITDQTHKEGMEQPIFHWTPSIGVCGMGFVSSDRYPAWKGDILSGSLKYNYLDRTVLNEHGEFVRQEKLFPTSGRLRSIYEGVDGYIYLGYEKPGKVYRIVPKK